MWPIVVIVAQLTAAQLDAAQAAYHRLSGIEIEKHKASEPPPKDAQRSDVSERIRSASFGHRTWLLVAPDGARFWVQYGPSTNRPGGTYGPFAVATTPKK